MSAAAVRGVVRRLGPTPEPPPDAELVGAFASRRDPAAFAELVRRHGPTVLGACRRVLGNSADAEDAFQAVFLVFSRKVGSVRPPGAVGGWLYGVAVRTASKARVAAARRRRREMNVLLSRGLSVPHPAPRLLPQSRLDAGSRPEASAENAELRSVLDEELARLPEPLRAAVVLCDLHGRTRAEAAAELGCPEGTVAARLHRARKKLADALTRRGLALPAAGIAAVLEAAPVSAALAQSAFACATGGATVAVQALAREVLRSMTTTAHLFAAGVLALVAGGLLAAAMVPVADAPGSSAPEPRASATGDAKPDPPAPEKPAPEPGAWREVKVLDQAGWLTGSVAYSPDGKTLFVGGTDGHARAYAAGEFKQLWDHKGEGKLSAVAVAPDGKRVAAGTRDGVQLLDADTGKAGDRLEEKGMDPLAVGFFEDTPLADGIPPVHHLALADARGCAVKSWRDGRDVSTIRMSSVAAGAKPAEEYAVPLAVAPNRRRVVVTGPVDRATGKNVLWAWAAGARVPNELLEGHKAVVVSAAWSNDGKLIVTGDADGVVITWDAAPFKEKSRLKLGGRVVAVAVTGGSDPADGELGEPRGKILRRPEPGVVEINLGSDAQVKAGLTFTVLPSDFPERGRQSRMRVMRVPDGAGGYKNVERFVEKAKIEVTEVLGPNLSRCRVTHEFDPIRDGAAAGDLIYKPAGRKGSHVAAAVASVLPAPNRNADYTEEVFVWPTDDPPKQPKPVSRHDAGGPFAGVAGLAFSPDGKSLASAFCNFTHLARGGELRGTVRVFAVADEKPKPEAPPAAQKWTERAVLTHHAEPVDSVAFAPDGKSFVSGGADGRVLLWNAEALKPQELGAVAPAGKFTAVAYSHDGRLVAATRDKVTGFFDPAKRQVVRMNPPFPGGRGVAFSPDGKWVAYSDGYTTGFRALPPGDGEAGGAMPGTLEDQLAAPVAWSADSLYLAHVLPSADPNGDWRVGIMGVTADTKPQNLTGFKGKVTALAWSKDGKLLATGGGDGVVTLWDGKPPFKMLRVTGVTGKTKKNPARALAFSPDGSTLAVAAELDEGTARSNRVVLFDTATGKATDGLKRAEWKMPVRSVAFSPDGKTLVAAYGIDRKDVKPLMTPDEMKAAGAVVVWERKP